MLGSNDFKSNIVELNNIELNKVEPNNVELNNVELNNVEPINAELNNIDSNNAELINIEMNDVSTIYHILQIMNNVTEEITIEYVKGIKLTFYNANRMFILVDLPISDTINTFNIYNVSKLMNKKVKLRIRNLTELLKDQLIIKKKQINTISFRVYENDLKTLITKLSLGNKVSIEHESKLCTINNEQNNDSSILPSSADFTTRKTSNVICVDCKSFHNACREISESSQLIKITCDTKNLIISQIVNGKRFMIELSEDNKKFTKFTGIFRSSDINSMYAICNLSESMRIFIYGHDLLALHYNVLSSGDMCVFLQAQKNDSLI